MVRRDAIAAVATLALGAGAAVAAAKLPFGGLRNPGPGFFALELRDAGARAVLVLLRGATADAAGEPSQARHAD